MSEFLNECGPTRLVAHADSNTEVPNQSRILPSKEFQGFMGESGPQSGRFRLLEYWSTDLLADLAQVIPIIV